ncbi:MULTISPECIES: L,D-transpeptidase [Sphingobacterium]|uniref:L,D-transpeptidase n=1 Tax=Sphingobacterium TaxID=28453 RepID=UPI0013DBE4A7|nr:MULTISPECIES: L,D-transpeptidase [unclassified Sphingobacterium]
MKFSLSISCAGNFMFFVIALTLFVSCDRQASPKNVDSKKIKLDSIALVKKAEEEEKQKAKPRTASDIVLTKDLIYDKYTLEDRYKYRDTFRVFQWEKIKEKLAYIENFQREHNNYGLVVNYKNRNGEAPTVANFKRNAYKRVSDTLGTERYQSAPLYKLGETKTPTIYGRDGSLVKLLSSDTLKMVRIKGLTNIDGEWDIPKRYVKSIGDTATFKHVVVVDVTNQNICALEHSEKEWIIRSMNPATTGKHNPPYAMETPVGIYLLQEQKNKMFYYADGTTTIAGYAPWASRFTNGAYIHGVPTNDPKAKIIEHSWTLGTTPRSHMCVRNASSHAKFVYDWIKPFSSLVIVIN